MRILFLNTWKGKTGEVLANFLRTHAGSVDVFCLQEATDNVEVLAQSALPGYTTVTARKNYKVGMKAGGFQQATFFKKDMTLRTSEPVFPLGEDRGLGLYTEFAVEGKALHLINYHGIAFPGEKLDNEGRLRSSEGIIELLSQKQGAKIIGGDFNLLPETKSIQMFEEVGYVNHIKKNKIITTRNRLSWEQYPANPKQCFADYVFTSPEAKVIHFEVIDNEVSDHLPMILEVGTTM